MECRMWMSKGKISLRSYNLKIHLRYVPAELFLTLNTYKSYYEVINGCSL